MAIIEKPGKRLEAFFECLICGCEYRGLRMEFEGVKTRVWAQLMCPCCGYSNECQQEGFKEVRDND